MNICIRPICNTHTKHHLTVQSSDAGFGLKSSTYQEIYSLGVSGITFLPGYFVEHADGAA